MSIPENILRVIQDCIASVPVIVLGSGASMAYGMPGMSELATYLINEIDGSQEESWDRFKNEIACGRDLETALINNSISEELQREIVFKTRDLILEMDLAISQKIIQRGVRMRLCDLLAHLMRTASPNIKIVTTNYDRLAEYAIDMANICCCYGFQGGYFQNFNSGIFNKEKIELLKVHGSLDWFLDDNSQKIIALPDRISEKLPLTPLMVTPGLKKYEATHDEPFRSIITRTDMAFTKAHSVLCIGYGFNDSHIQTKLLSKISSNRFSAVILAKKLTPNALNFIRRAKGSKVIGIEEHGEGSIIRPSWDNEVVVSDSAWQLDSFIGLVL